MLSQAAWLPRVPALFLEQPESHFVFGSFWQLLALPVVANMFPNEIKRRAHRGGTQRGAQTVLCDCPALCWFSCDAELAADTLYNYDSRCALKILKDAQAS